MKAIHFRDVCLSDEDLWDLRKRLYHSKGSGYVLLKGFIDPLLVQHLINYWVESADPLKSHFKFTGKGAFFPGCPAYYSHDANQGHRTFYNPIWAVKDIDVVFAEVTSAMVYLRSRIEGKAFTRESTATIGQRCSVPRLVITKDGDNILAPHSDYGLDEPSMNDVDLARLQTTLFLSRYGEDKDYSGSGFEFTRNDGVKIQCEKDLGIEAGDLLVWRYSNTHQISSIRCKPGQMGSVRILIPPEKIISKPLSRISWQALRGTLSKVKRRIMG